MKKLLFILLASVALACSDNSDRSREAAADEDVDIGSGEEVSPQLELDSTESRFKVDSISSPAETDKETKDKY